MAWYSATTSQKFGRQSSTPVSRKRISTDVVETSHNLTGFWGSILHISQPRGTTRATKMYKPLRQPRCSVELKKAGALFLTVARVLRGKAWTCFKRFQILSC